MSETNTAQQAAETPENVEAKTFTQEEVNAMISERVKRERAKYEGFDVLKEKAKKFDEIEEAGKTELQKSQEQVAELQAKLDKIQKDAEIGRIKSKISTEKGIPVDLLTGETEEACLEQAEKILAFAQFNGGYPVIRDAGEIAKTTKVTTRQQFADWVNENL